MAGTTSGVTRRQHHGCSAPGCGTGSNPPGVAGLVPCDFAHGDLNLTNVLSDGTSITGVVDWDEFGLNNRAADLTTILFDIQRLQLSGYAPPPARASAQLLGRIGKAAGEQGLRCAITYAAIARLAVAHRRPENDALANWIEVTSSVLDLVGTT